MKIIYSILVILIFSFSTIAQTAQNEEVDKLFSEWDRAGQPGGALAVIKDGRIIYSKGYGLADLEHDIPITASTNFYIGSVSKQFVTFCILLLEEEGKLNLDDKIQKYLPDFPEYEAPLTIRHFIHHTSGVRDFLTLMNLKGRSYLDNIDPDEVYELIKNQKELNFTPGDQYMYSNSCYFMLGMIVEKAAGKSLKEFAHENIFEPLGMSNTQFYDDNRDLIKNRAFSYSPREEGEGFENLIMRYDLVGSGGIYSNVEDLYLWDQNFYRNKLGKGSQKIIEKMHTEGLLNNGESTGYAFAIQNGTYRGLKTVSHGGALAGYRAQLMRFPEQNFSVILLANRSDANPNQKCYDVADIFLKDEFLPTTEKWEKEESGTRGNDPENAEKDKSEIDIDLDQYTGSYYSEELDVTYKISPADKFLNVKIPNDPPEPFEYSEPDIFVIYGASIRFFRSDDEIKGFELDLGRVKNLKFIKR